MSIDLVAPELITAPDQQGSPTATAVREGLSARDKWLPSWLFYDAAGSALFEQITTLPEYYPTRTERAIFQEHAAEIVNAAVQLGLQRGVSGSLRLLELGAGSASKTGILLAAAVTLQGATEYLPVDVSESALQEAQQSLSRLSREIRMVPQIANYVTEALRIPHHSGPTLALYIGSSIGNFSPEEAVSILQNLRAQLRPGDSLLLGTDLVKDASLLLAAYDDAQGVTAAFNRNMLQHINRELRADFDLSRFQHRAVWNSAASRMEMHLESTAVQTVHVPGATMVAHFERGETIHTENSYKFTGEIVRKLLASAGFRTQQAWHDERDWFAVTLAAVAD